MNEEITQYKNKLKDSENRNLSDSMNVLMEEMQNKQTHTRVEKEN